MRRWLTIICLAAIVCWTSQCPAEPPMHTPLFQRWITHQTHFEMSGGRILSNKNGNWQYPNGSHPDEDGETHERITFNGNGMTGSVVYSYQRTKTDAESKKDVVIDLAIEFNSDGRFVLRYADKDAPQSYFELMQTPGQPIRLSLPPADKPRVMQGSTIWQLLIVHAEDCRKSVIPLASSESMPA